MTVLPKLIYRFNVIPIKILAEFFADIGNLLLKFINARGNARGPE